MQYLLKKGAQVAPGDVIMTGIPGPSLDGKTSKALRDLRPSGVILFRHNVEGAEQLRRLTAELKALPWRPLIGVDHEGGKIMRLGPPFTQFPPAREIGLTGKPELAYEVGRAMGVELASVGIDIDFAPVLDVDSNPRNPIIGERAFGPTPAEVEAMALACMRGLADGGVVPCGKHFPGHGDTDLDSHTDLPFVRRSRAELEATELPPFRAAVAAQIPLLMTAHVRYPALDPGTIATFSQPIVGRLLREEMGFSGVVITDALEMRAATGEMPVAEAAVHALHAGADWTLICGGLDSSLEAAERIAAAVMNGELKTSRLTESAGRIGAIAAPATATAELPLPLEKHEALNRRIRSLTS